MSKFKGNLLTAVISSLLMAQSVNAQEAQDIESTPLPDNTTNDSVYNNSKADNLKIGFVNIRKLMAQAPQLKTIQENLAKEFEKENQAIIFLRSEIAKLSAQYDEKADKNRQITLQKAINDKQREVAQLQQRLQDAYSLSRNEALGKLQTLIVSMVAKVSQERQLDIVLNNTGVIYVSSRIDITPAVFAYLSEQTID
ncbi:MAG: hypothetical protein CSA45_06455 [Gammaproteobacteria bacterium]|nr:MAG: hypothetical protein CSA45_06455 [Gammaproteobacteria bacterium]